MTTGIQLYTTINQLLIGKPFTKLPSGLKEFLKDNQLDKLYDAVIKIPQESLTGVERAFLNLLRVPGYAVNLQKETLGLLPLSVVADTVRQANLDPEKCYAWGVNLIEEASNTRSALDLVSDGKLSMSQATYESQEDLMAAMCRAFYMYCWGTITPNATTKGIVRTIIGITSLKEPVKLDVKKVTDLMGSCVAQGLSLADVGKSVVYVSDLSLTYQLYGGLFYWQDENKANVDLIVPKGTTDTTLIKANLSFQKFLDLMNENSQLMTRIRSKGSEVMILPLKTQ